MTINLLCPNPQEPTLLFRNDATHKTTRVDVSMHSLLHFLMLELRDSLTEKILNKHTNNAFLQKLKTAIFSMQYEADNTWNNTILTTTSELAIKIMMAQLNGEMDYISSYGVTRLNLYHHSEQARDVLIDFVIHVIHSVENINELKEIKIDWVDAWPKIYDQWSTSFELGFLANIPKLLSFPAIMNVNPTETTPQECDIMVNT